MWLKEKGEISLPAIGRSSWILTLRQGDEGCPHGGVVGEDADED